ncbi:MAG: recombination protein RecR [Candidatus Omnitrophica bacterium]|nr:recombination protein RecR [Candidatus Omnitrophota bacterium]
MRGLTASMEALLKALNKLPGVGPRTAERFAFFLLTQPGTFAKELAEAILKVKETIGFCRVCFNLADEELCAICRDPARDKSILCVVEHPRSIIAMEKSGGFKGIYHVLLGVLSPLDGVGPKELKIHELKSRLKAGEIREVILATDTDLEGEATALYLSRELKGLAAVSRLAAGLPMGSSVEFSDQVTLGRALEGRRQVAG